MPANLDSCIADLFEPGNIGSSSGITHPPHYSGYLLAERTIEADFSGVGPISYINSGTQSLLLTITGTWVATIQVNLEFVSLTAFTSNVTDYEILVPRGGLLTQVAMIAYTSGTAHVVLKARDRIMIETMILPPQQSQIQTLTFAFSPPFFVGFLKLD